MYGILWAIAITIFMVLIMALSGFLVIHGPTIYVGPVSVTFGYGVGAWFPGRYL